MKTQRTSSQARQGSTVVEAAIVMPLIVSLVLGTVEMSRAYLVQHTMEEATQAACRLYIIESATQQQAQDALDAAMANGDLTTYSVVFDPPSKDGITLPLQPVSVTVSLNFNDVAWMNPWFLSSKTLTATCTLPADVRAPQMTTIYDALSDDNVNDGITRDTDQPILSFDSDFYDSDKYDSALYDD